MFVFIEKAFFSAKFKDWEAFGINLDKGYALNRYITGSNQKLDLAYATARTFGCYGGFANGKSLFLVCPKEKSDIIKEEVFNAIRHNG